MYNAVFVSRVTCIFTCFVRSAGGSEASRDRLLVGTIESARIYCVRIGFLYILYMRANFVLENRTPVNNSVRLLSSSGRDVLSSKGRPTELRAVAVYTCSVDDVR